MKTENAATVSARRWNEGKSEAEREDAKVGLNQVLRGNVTASPNPKLPLPFLQEKFTRAKKWRGTAAPNARNVKPDRSSRIFENQIVGETVPQINAFRRSEISISKQKRENQAGGAPEAGLRLYRGTRPHTAQDEEKQR